MTLPVRLHALATAVPPHILRQDDVEAMAAETFRGRCGVFERLRAAYGNAGVDRRHSCMPPAWYREPHGWVERSRLFVEHGLDLLGRLAADCLAQAGLRPSDIDVIVVVSTTGIATPSLDAQLMERLAFRRDVTRLPIFGFGCAGGVLGLARAAALARSMPGQRVLCLVVELCALTFRANDLSKSNIIATALFGDGAAGAILSTEGSGPRITGWGEHTWRDSLDVMGWRIADDGLGVLFSQDIPTIVRTRLRAAADEALARQGLTLADIDRFVCHPGGPKVVAAIEDAFALAPGTLDDARAVMRDYGNMSAASVLFVLERALAETGGRRCLLTAMGPGFTAAFLTLECS